jgi:hypothetical protein
MVAGEADATAGSPQRATAQSSHGLPQVAEGATQVRARRRVVVDDGVDLTGETGVDLGTAQLERRRPCRSLRPPAAS